MGERGQGTPHGPIPAVSVSDERLFAEGVYHARGVVVPFKSEQVRAMVQRGLDLAPQSLTPAGTHPVTVLFGRHTDVRPNILPIRGASYREFLLAVPYLRRLSGGVPAGPVVATMPRLYLNSWLFVVLGWMYAYPKWRARIEDDASRYRVRSLIWKRPRLDAGFAAYGPTGPVTEFPHFAPLAPIFSQPFAQKFSLTPWICSLMQFDLDRARVRAVRGSFKIESAFLPGLPVGRFEFEGIDKTPLGGFHIEVPWRLSLPMLCGRVRQEEKARLLHTATGDTA